MIIVIFFLQKIYCKFNKLIIPTKELRNIYLFSKHLYLVTF